MIVVKQALHDPVTNSVEVTWVDRTIAPDRVIPAQVTPETVVPATFDDEGNIVTQEQVIPGEVIPERIEPGEVTDINVKCHSYAGVQMDALEADLGADAADHASLIALVRAGIVPLTQEEIDAARKAAVPVSVSPRQIRQALTATDMRQQVETAVAAGGQNMKDWWSYSTAFERTNPQVTAMAAALGVSEASLDDLWTLAASL